VLRNLTTQELMRVFRYFEGAIAASEQRRTDEAQMNVECLRELTAHAVEGGRLEGHDLNDILQVCMRFPDLCNQNRPLVHRINDVYAVRPYQEDAIDLLRMTILIGG